jgi:Flp pilus assembly protein TadD
MQGKMSRRSGGVVAALVVAAAALGAAGIARGGAAAPGPLPQGAAAEEVIRANNRGAALMERFQHSQALEAFAPVTAKAPGWAPGFVNLGLAALYTRENARAAQAFREAIRLDPGLPQGHYGLGTVLKNEGNSEEAIAAFEKARALEPEDADVLYNLGLLKARQRRFEEATSLLLRARQIDPNNVSIRYQLARALLQSGQTAAGQKEMATYQKLAANPKFAVPTGNQYGEAGRLALVMTDYTAFGGPPPPPRPIAVRFSDALEASGIAMRHGGPGGEAPGGATPGLGALGRAARFGSGVAVGDIDGDGRPDLVFANADVRGSARPAIYRNLGNWTFEDVTPRSGVTVSGAGMAALLADYDNDGDLDLYLTRFGGGALLQNQGGGVFKDVTARAGAAIGGFALGAAWADVDHDGDLDLYVCRRPEPGAAAKAAAVLLRNRGDGTFKEATAELRLAGPATGSVGALFGDFDADRDIDAVVSAAGGQDALLDNRREAGFEDRGGPAGLARRGAGRGVSAGDVNGDGLPDLVFAGGPAEANLLYLNGPLRRFEPHEIPKPKGISSYGSVLFDADNDGDLDLFVTGSANLFYLNDGRGGFRNAGDEAGMADLPVKDGRGAAAADLDGDGDLDLVVTQNGGRPILLRNEGGNRNRWLEVDPRGLNSNRDGIGAKIDVQSGAMWQRREVQAGGGYLSQSPIGAHFGLGDRGVADFVRLLWPGGVLQSEMDVPAGQRVEQAELDRKGSSCPLLFAWNGGKYRFVTDFLGVGGLGMWMAPEVYGRPDPDEYVKIEPDQLLPRDGGYDLQLVENLEEVAYLDEATLFAVDHPRGIDVYPNESFGGDDRSPHRLFAVERSARIAPSRAVDHHGRDVTGTILKIDRDYPDDFRRLRLAGYAEMHHLTLEFPAGVAGKEGLVLFLYGWVDFEYASSNFAAHQAGIVLTPPVLEVEGEDGQYAPAIESMGFPAGMPRMMAVDLSPLGPLRTPRLRLRTNMRVYWDQIFLARPLPEEETAGRVRTERATLSGAHLHRRGFPREHSPDGREPKVYDYGILDNSQPFRVMTGDYTRFGRVTDLLTRADDRFVIFGKGEEVTLEFATKGLPETPKGWVRSFLFYSNGYCKDMDPHTAHGETVEPLPFHGMSAYPYPEGESYPDDAAHREYRATYNTRRLEGR